MISQTYKNKQLHLLIGLPGPALIIMMF